MNGEYESKDNQKDQLFKQGMGLLQRLYFEQVVRPLLEEQFGATQNPFWLGKALNAKPELLHEAGIRKLVIHYLRSTKERDQLIRGLKQKKPKREKIKLPPGCLKFFYQAALKLIHDEYNRLKTKYGRKPKTQAERTMILRRAFPNLNRRAKRSFADGLSRIPTLVAKHRKPSEMAFYVIYHTYNTLYPGKVSVRELRRAFGLKP